jgi:hypothetical protein
MFPPREKDTGPFRSQEPFVTVGGQEIDRRSAYVQREDAQGLDAIETQQGPSRVNQLGQAVQIVPPAAGVGYPTQANDPRSAIASCGESIEVESPAIGGETARFDPPIG